MKGRRFAGAEPGLRRRRSRALPGLPVLLAAAVLAVVGICAGAAVPGSARADDDNGGNVHKCVGGTKTDETVGDVHMQTCTITAATGTCIQRSRAQMAVQRCTFTQTSPPVMGSTLRATAIQTHDPEGGPSGTQDGIQVITASQTNDSPGKSNYLYGTQIADYCLGAGDNHEDEDGDWNDEDHDGDLDDDGACEDEDEEDDEGEEAAEDDNGPLIPDPIVQSQRVTQTIDAIQDAVGSGKDFVYALQVENLHERAANAEAITQDQNTVARDNECGTVSGLVDFLQANSCAAFKQSADSAKVVKLLQVYNLSQSARNTDAGFQNQGDPGDDFGGLEHSFDLTGGTGTPTQRSDQFERLNQFRHNTGTMAYHQFAGPRKGVGLMNDPGASAVMNQDVEVFSNGPGFGSQGAFLEITCSGPVGLPGDPCRGIQRAQLNEASYFDEDSGDFILMVARCEETEGGQVCEPVEG